MKYSFLLLIVCVFFFRCKEWEEKKIVPPVETFSWERLHEKLRRLDSTSHILHFKPDTGIIDFNTIVLHEFSIDTIMGLKSNVKSVIETELRPQRKGRPEEGKTNEYYFENGRIVKSLDNISDDSLIETLEYDAKGRLLEIKKVWPKEDNSLVMEYQYDSQSRLHKILYFNDLDLLIRSSHLFYHKNGNVDSVFYEDTEGKDLRFKYFINSNSRSFLQVRIDDKGEIVAASFFELDDYNRVRYEEEYLNDDGGSIFFHQYEYDSNGDLKKFETLTSFQSGKTSSTYSYPRRDTAGYWIEKLTYVDGNLYYINRRVITYK